MSLRLALSIFVRTPSSYAAIEGRRFFRWAGLEQRLEVRLRYLIEVERHLDAVDCHLDGLAVAVGQNPCEHLAAFVLLVRLELDARADGPVEVLRLRERPEDPGRGDLEVVLPRQDILAIDIEEVPDHTRDLRAVLHRDSVLPGAGRDG